MATQLKTRLTDDNINKEAAHIRRIDELEARLDRLDRENDLLFEAEWDMIVNPTEVKARPIIPEETFVIDRTY